MELIIATGLGISVGIVLTKVYYYKAIGLYNKIFSGEYATLVTKKDNPRVFEASLALSMGMAELAEQEEEEDKKPNLSVVEGGSDD